MRLCAVQPHLVIGNLHENLKCIRTWVHKAVSLSSDAILFPECTLTGYLPLDLLFQPDFVKDHENCLDQIRDLSHNIDILMGSLDHSPLASKKRFYNAYHHFSKGRLVTSVFKSRLPNDDIFYESRFFTPNPNPGENNVLTLGSLNIGVGICEDMWNDSSLFETIAQTKPIDLFVCPSASPYTVGKPKQRKIQIYRILDKVPKPFLFLNQVSSFDGILLDGHSYFMSEQKKIVGQLPAFEDHALLIDMNEHPKPGDAPKISTMTLTSSKPEKNHQPIQMRQTRIATLAKALEFGLKQFIYGSGLNRALICVSGGIDSALALILTKRAIGADKCFALILPSPYNKEQGTLDAVTLCQKHQINYQTLPITKLMYQFSSILKRSFGQEAKPVLFQNIQARIRGILAMGFSNQLTACLIGTSNKSELAMGYATLYGDLCAGILPLGDLLKTQVYALSEYYRDSGEFLPDTILKRVPSAELAPRQKDSDDLPPYTELDPAIRSFLLYETSPDSHVSPSPLMDQVEQGLKRSQFKRKQAAPIIKISYRDLSRGRQVIISGGAPLEDLKK